jgi:hypothetical protein
MGETLDELLLGKTFSNADRSKALNAIWESIDQNIF